MKIPSRRLTRAAIAALALGLPAAFLTPAGPTAAASALPATPGAAATPSAADHAETLQLGAPDLPESRTVTELAPGLTRTSITRGAADPSLVWTAEVAIPSASPDPDAPASALSDESHARAVASKLEAAGIQARVEHVQSPQLADAGGDLGYRVRAGQFASKADGAPAVEQIKAAGYASSVLYTGWDGDAGTIRTARGPWKLEVLTIDPKQFRGQLTSGFGPNLQDRETTSQLVVCLSFV